MLELLCPTQRFSRIVAIEVAWLQAQGFAGILVDVDNTLLPWAETEMCSEVERWLCQVLAAGIKVGLVSNNGEQRVARIAERLGVPFQATACKPLQLGFRKVLGDMGLKPIDVAVIGDQLFTDVLGGNWMGCSTVWVMPLARQEFIGTKVVRCLERIVVWVLRRRKMLKDVIG